MRIVFHGHIAACYLEGFRELLGEQHEIAVLPDPYPPHQEPIYGSADVLIATRLDATLTPSERLRLFQVPSAGTEGVEEKRLPTGAALCNCFGHEGPMAEYVVAALLLHYVPLIASDRHLREGRWPYYLGDNLDRRELAGTSVGLLGYGHIGRAIARRLEPFGVRIEVANRSPVPALPPVARYWPLSELEGFMGAVDAVVVSLPLVPETASIVGPRALGAMRPKALLVNVGRGPLIDEAALYSTLKDRRIGGAVIDTWYVYPKLGEAVARPSHFPFHELDNIVMTDHMSGWTPGTRLRRQKLMVENIARLSRGEDLLNRLK